jgi:hypothetical protein
MKRLLFALLALIAVGCGSDEVVAPPTTAAPTTTTIPGAEQRDLLEAARLLWAAGAPANYEMTYTLACECDQGPWLVRVENGQTVAAGRIGPEDGGTPPYLSVDAIFRSIQAALDEGRFPVDVAYDESYGFPRSYIFNEPELAVDGGFILTVTGFEADPGWVDPAARARLEDARARWADNGPADYDYTFTRGCFCPEEFVGPYQVSVVDGEIVAASFRGTDLFDIGMLEISRYDEIVKTVEGLFDEIARAMVEADAVTAEYDPVLGFPTNVSIDWIRNAADDEVFYTIADLRDPAADPATCSTEGWDAGLLPQPGLPDAVAATRRALYEAAMACDFERLTELAASGSRGFETTFGGSGPEYFRESESRGEPLMRMLVEHLNLAYAAAEDGTGDAYYAWPSAFINLTSAGGEGIPAADYAALLEYYPLEDLEYMFDQIGGYTGWRNIIAADGEWLYFIAGD